MIEANRAVGPRTFSTGDPLFSGNGPHRNELASFEQAEHDIVRLQSLGATALKQYLQPNREQRQWITAIARKKGLRVTREGSSDLDHKLTMLMDGQPGFEHPTPSVPLYPDAAKDFRLPPTAYSPTLLVGCP